MKHATGTKRLGSMPPNAQGPVQVRKPVAVTDTVNGQSLGRSGFHQNACRQVGGRRIFVQTYSGNVLGIELDRADKVESVKKKVQAAFGVPTEQSTLVFGDHVLDKDLSEIRGDAPLLLTRGIYRSSSTPCLSPRGRDFHQNSVFEIVGGSKTSNKVKRLVREAVKGIEAGVQPILAGGGLGGAYYFRNCLGDNIAIVKPTDEEPFAPNNPKGFTGRALGQPGLKPSIRVGETGLREVAAYLLDHGHFAKVPVTALVNATHSVFNVNPEYAGAGHTQPGNAKIASFQQFVRHDFVAEDIGTSRFPVSSVHRIGILDIRLFNTDRHAGNILVKKVDHVQAGNLFEDSVELIPIDHGLCLPETLDALYFEWLHWHQASIPFSKDELDYIENLDPGYDCDLLRKELPTMREACLRMLVLSTTFLKLAAKEGLTLSEIGGMMTRDLCGIDEEPSELEKVCMQAKTMVDEELLSLSSEGDSFGVEDFSFAEDISGEDDFQFDMDDNVEVPALKLPEIHRRPPYTVANGCRSMSPLASRSPRWVLNDSSPEMVLPSFSSLEISPIPRSPLGMQPELSPTSPSANIYDSLSRMSVPSRSTSMKLNTKFRSHTQIEKPRSIGLRGYAALNVAQTMCDVNEDCKEQLATGPLVLTNMNEKVWSLFLEHFQELLPESFAKVRFKSKNQVQRLGTSCRF
ncbi:hypothetical protein M758_4G118800 [Ceratodon purpureus]|uniref:1-phosphatidylinositol 4-kinase n=1 Tax=Ceratodon purpureus TaxID=3225 RepID=A0A8T0IB86_CERPU|nr:hypothetical protein KC19_4G118500 [Ceratodon purpureus]KAG0619122.1 hypothetical protein M758_4G118800 [Ceratodon purpureus]